MTLHANEIQLEAVLRLPAGSGPFAAAVVCHPHPEYGGDMNNSVVIAVCRALGDANVASLRFNFRGVGASQGEFENGIGEQDDVRAALAYLSSEATIDPSRIGLAGYSFGSIVALATALKDERARALVLISPPITFFPFGTDQIRGYANPKLILCGTADMFVNASEIAQILDPEQLVTIDGADHFWMGFEKQVGSMAADFLSSAL